MLAMPDAVLGIASYAITMALAAAGGTDRAQRWPLLPLALAVKTLVDAASAAALTREQLTVHRALCSWCTIASLATAAAAPLAIPEARAALRTLRQRM